MTSTGTYNYSPAAANLMLVAFERIGLRREQVLAEHIANATDEANLVQVKFANAQPNLWTSQLQSLVLTPGTPTYTMPGNLIAIQAAYITTTSGTATLDRIIWPLSTYEYSSLPNKTMTGAPTSYWYNRQIIPQISLWPTPDSASVYTLNVRVLSQIQDASLPSGTTLNLPYRWLDAFCSELSYRLARIYAPDKEAMRKADAAEAWQNAANEDQERVPLYLTPGLDSYFR